MARSSPLRSPALLAAAALLPLAARAQLAPFCPSSLSWLDNSMGQDPCHVVSFLFGQCTGTTNFNLTALGTQFGGYAGPTTTDSGEWTYNGCLCSMPVYNLIQACQVCQGKNIGTYQVWTASCNSSFTGSTSTPTLYFPQQVPSGTVIPPWALIDNTNQPWSEQEAQQNISATASSSISIGSTASVVSGTGGEVNPTSSPSGSSSSSKSSSNAGAIAGGVVGGLAVLAIIGGAGTYMLRRMRKKDLETASGTTGYPPSSYHGGVSAAQPMQGGMTEVRRPIALYPDQPGSPDGTYSSGARGSVQPSQWGGSSEYGQVNPFGSQGTPSPGPHGGPYSASASGSMPGRLPSPWAAASAGVPEVMDGSQETGSRMGSAGGPMGRPGTGGSGGMHVGHHSPHGSAGLDQPDVYPSFPGGR